MRIVGGNWRGRRLTLAPGAELRPTPDRVRETLFNWLQPLIAGSRCLDLFAGSGALGFEAVSRGAERAVLVDRDTEVVRQLQRERDRLQSAAIEIVQAHALDYLGGMAITFDVVFLDPPFAQRGLLADCIERLESRGWLAEGARVYLESRVGETPPALPDAWSLLRKQRAGGVDFRLAVASAVPARAGG